MNSDEIIALLRSMSNPKNVEGMARFGINSENTLGISMVEIRAIAKKIKKDHELAIELWESGIHEAKILAALIADPKQLTEKTMDEWVIGFDSWDVCDQVCFNLFDKTSFVYKKVLEWAAREEEFVRRAAFALIAGLAVHNKKDSDSKFEQFYPLILNYCTDDRNFVKKAINWALRQIGKRNLALNESAIQLSKEMLKIDSKSARWIANDTIRELESSQIQERLKLKGLTLISWGLSKKFLYSEKKKLCINNPS